MKKDTEALRSSGGTGVESRTFSPADLAGDATFVPPVASAPKVAPPKALFISIGIVVVLALAAAAVYFFILPSFSPDEPAVVIDDTPEEEEFPLPVEPAFTHQSFFASAPDVSTDVALLAVSLDEINGAMQQSNASAGIVEEFAFTVREEPVTTGEIMGLLLPAVNSAIFEEDFTAFVYYDENGKWPGYVFSLGDNIDATSTVPIVSGGVEGGANLSAFYLTAPGAADAGGFKGGSVAGISTRYLPFGAPGASFNYGWSGKYLVLTTSFAGFQEAAALLGD